MSSSTPRLRPRLFTMAAVLVLHLVVVGSMQRQLQARAGRPTTDAVRQGSLAVRLIPPIDEVRQPIPAEIQTIRATPVRPAGNGSRATARGVGPVAPGLPPTPEPGPALSSVPVDTPSGSPLALPGLDSVATRRAIREAALGAGPGAQQAVEAGAALRAPASAERLSSQVQRAARGDCSKGEYTGGGMGLLSLPFLAAAALKDECAK